MEKSSHIFEIEDASIDRLHHVDASPSIHQKKFQVPIFEVDVVIILCSSADELKNFYNDKDWTSTFDQYDGITIDFADIVHIAFMTADKMPSHATIAHEAKHAVNIVFQKIGQRLDEYNDEVECYMLGWMISQIYDFINDVNKVNA